MSGPTKTTTAAAAFATAPAINTTTNTTENGMDDDDSLQEPLLPPALLPNTDAEYASGARLLDSSVLETDAVAVAIEFDESVWDHGEIQQERCRDWFWGFLFLLQFGAVAALAISGIRNMIKALSEWTPDDDDDHHTGDNTDLKIVWFVLSLVGSTIALSFFLVNVLLGPFASMLMQISLVLPPLSYLVISITSLLTLNVPLAFLTLVWSAMGTYYAVLLWNNIPFAAANLKVALSAIGDNHGLWILAYAVSIKAYALVLLWSSAVAELVVYSPSWVFDCSADETTGQPVCQLSTGGHFIALGMLLSLFWTSQVLNNSFHATVAGVVGTWWFDREESQSARHSGCCGCSPAVYDSCIRSGLYSFGSICFGSLLVGILRVLNFLIRCGREKRNDQRRRQGTGPNASDFLCCLLSFVMEQMEAVMEYFNSWAFIYVGLYGYDYLSAGKQVTALFQERGWGVIINDQLLGRSLSSMSWLIGNLSGLLGVLLGWFVLGPSVMVSPVTAIPVFFGGAVLGRASCQVLFGVVTSAVDTVVVCFAESPNELRNKHDPELFRDLVHGWRKAYPVDCGF